MYNSVEISEDVCTFCLQPVNEEFSACNGTENCYGNKVCNTCIVKWQMSGKTTCGFCGIEYTHWGKRVLTALTNGVERVLTSAEAPHVRVHVEIPEKNMDFYASVPNDKNIQSNVTRIIREKIGVHNLRIEVYCPLPGSDGPDPTFYLNNVDDRFMKDFVSLMASRTQPPPVVVSPRKTVIQRIKAFFGFR